MCVCVCTIHQNVKLMRVGSHMDDSQLEDELETPIKNYKHALEKTIRKKKTMTFAINQGQRSNDQ